MPQPLVKIMATPGSEAKKTSEDVLRVSNRKLGGSAVKHIFPGVGPAEYLDLDSDLVSGISVDGLEYLRQFGVEEYTLDDFLGGSPGKYYSDIPLERNPEAYFDVLTRESMRKRNQKHDKVPSSKQQGSSQAMPASANNNPDLANGIIDVATSKSSPLTSGPSTSTPESKIKISKRVSFKENPTQTVHILPSESSYQREAFPSPMDPNKIKSPVLNTEESLQQGNHMDHPNANNTKKSKKFKFPGIEKLLHKMTPNKSNDVIQAYDLDGVSLTRLTHNNPVEQTAMEFKSNARSNSVESNSEHFTFNKAEIAAYTQETKLKQTDAPVDLLKNGNNKDIPAEILEVISMTPSDLEERRQSSESLLEPFKSARTGNLSNLQQTLSSMSTQEVTQLRDIHGDTVLHAAAAHGYLDVTMYLCHSFPSLIKAENKAKLSPAHLAVQAGHVVLLEWMMQHTDIMAHMISSSNQRTLIHHAAKTGQEACMRMLLNKLSCVKDVSFIFDQYENSPAHLAARHGHLTCLQTLVEFGVDVCRPNVYGHSPCYFADFSNHRTCAAYLMAIEVCQQMALDLASLADEHLRLKDEHGAITKNLTESLTLNADLLRRLQELDQSGPRQKSQECSTSIQTLSNMTEILYRENRALRLKLGVQEDMHRRAATEKVLNHAKSLVPELEKEAAGEGGQDNRKYWMKVKEMERRLMGFQNMGAPPDVDPVEEARVMMRDRMGEASRRLVVYRTHVADLKKYTAARLPVYENTFGLSDDQPSSKLVPPFQESNMRRNVQERNQSFLSGTMTQYNHQDNRSHSSEGSARVVSVELPEEDFHSPSKDILVHTSSGSHSEGTGSNRDLTDIASDQRDSRRSSGTNSSSNTSLSSKSLRDLLPSDETMGQTKLERVHQHILSSGSHLNNTSNIVEIIEPGSATESTDLDEMDAIESASQIGDCSKQGPETDVKMCHLKTKHRDNQSAMPSKINLSSEGFKETYGSSKRSHHPMIISQGNQRPHFQVNPQGRSHGHQFYSKSMESHNYINYTPARPKQPTSECNQRQSHLDISNHNYHQSSQSWDRENTRTNIVNGQSHIARLNYQDNLNTHSSGPAPAAQSVEHDLLLHGFPPLNSSGEPDDDSDVDDEVLDEMEELLLDSNMRLLPSMQFDMQLSTIDEVSVVSGDIGSKLEDQQQVMDLGGNSRHIANETGKSQIRSSASDDSSLLHETDKKANNPSYNCPASSIPSKSEQSKFRHRLSSTGSKMPAELYNLLDNEQATLC